MQQTRVQISTLLILLSLVWIPETRVLLTLVAGSDAASTMVMKPLVAVFELLFVTAVLTGHQPLTLPEPVKRLRLPVALWFCWMLLASVYSEHTALALLRTAEWLSHTLFAIALIAYISRDESRIKEVVHALLTGFLIYTFLYLLLAPAGSKAAPGFDNIRHYDHYAVVALLLSLSIKRSGLFSLLSIFKLTTVTASWTILFFTGARGPLIAVIGSTLLLAFAGCFNKRTHLITILVITATIGALLSALLSDTDQGIYRIFHSVSEFTDIDSFSSRRVEVWSSSLLDVVTNKIFGLGPEGFIYGSYSSPRFILHPHNLLLQTAIEWGIPGSVLFFWLLHKLYTPVFKRINSGNHYVFAASWAAATYLIYSLITGNIYIPFSTFLFFVITALLISKTHDDVHNTALRRARLLPVYAIAVTATLVNIYVVSQYISVDQQAPDTSQARLFRAVPAFATHPSAQSKVVEWARDDLHSGKKEAAMQWLHWGATALPRSWIPQYAEAEILIQEGMTERANTLLNEMNRYPLQYQRQIDCMKWRIQEK